MTHNFTINVIVNASTGTVHAVTPGGLENPGPDGRYAVACGRVLQGTWHAREQDMVTCGDCRTKPLHLPMYRADGALPTPAANRTGELPHAYPTEVAEYSTCTVCGAEVFYDDTDDEGTGIWSHTETGDYFCEAI